MKKLLSLMLVICLLFAGFVSLISSGGSTTSFTDESGTVDYGRIYAMHKGDEIIGELNGRDVTWDEFFYGYYTYAKDTEQYMQQIRDYYGVEIGWNDVLDESTGETMASGLSSYAERLLAQYATIEEYAEEHGIDVGEDGEEEIKNMLESNILSLCGEGAGDEQFNEKLAELYMPRNLYDRMMRDSVLNEKTAESDTGLTNEEVVRMMEEEGYMHAGHILRLTYDSTTGESVSQDEARARFAEAQEISEKLKGIENDAERYAEFCRLAETNNEDSQSEYTFLPGTMVSEFETGVQSLKDYEVSEPIETSYGYHVIIHLPIDPEAALAEYYINGQTVTGKEACNQTIINEELNEIYAGIKLEYKEGFVVPDIAKFIKE